MVIEFGNEELKKLYRAVNNSQGETNGQVVIIGGSELFWGAPLLSLVAAARLVDMVYLATPTEQKEAAENTAIFSKLKSVIWVPREDIDGYIEKSDVILIGPGMMRFESEGSRDKIQDARELDGAGRETREITKSLLLKWPDKQWVVDAGSLQVMDPEWIPRKAILTPNEREFRMLFGTENTEEVARKYQCVIVRKGPEGCVTDGEITYVTGKSSAGLTKGGTGDVLAGVTVGLAARNPPLLAAAAASWAVKKTAEKLEAEMGVNFSSDDLANRVFEVMR